MVNPGLAQVIQHKDICHTIIDLCSSENDLPPKIPKSQLQNLKSKLQDPKSELQNPKLQNPKSKKSKLQDPKLQDPKSKLQNQNSKIQNQNSRSWGKLENGQLVHIIVSRYCNVQSIVLLDVFEGRMLKGIAKYAYQHEGGGKTILDP